MSLTDTKGAMLNDLYQLTMSYAYWKNGMADHEAVFNLFYRKAPFKGSYAVFCGLDEVVSLIENFKYDEEDIKWMEDQKGNDGKPLFEPKFIDFMRDFKLNVDVDAMPEGSVTFPNTPMVRVKGNIISCQLLETPLLNIVNFDTLAATKAARICTAAKSSAVFEFGLRRAQGPGAGLRASRAAWIAGCAGTSNMLASEMYGIPAKGTHAHSWVMSHDDELSSFLKYGQAMPGNCVLLVDTYDTDEGVKKACEAGKQIEANGGTLAGIRLDSGDLLELSKTARKILNKEGFKHTKIVASNDLDEYAIDDLKSKGARIDIYGVGTRLVTAFDQPALGGVYKLAAIRESADTNWKYKIKLSNEVIKISNPGIQKVRRYYQNKFINADVIYDEVLGASDMAVNEKTGLTEMIEGDFREMLEPVFRDRKLVAKSKALDEIRDYCQSEMASLKPGMKATLFPDFNKVCLDDNLYQLKMKFMRDIREKL